MASIVAMGAGALLNALAFSGTNYLFSHIDKSSAAEERRRHDKAIEQLQKARELWQQRRIEKLDFYNKFLQEQKLSTERIEDIDEAMRAYYRATGQKQRLAREPALSDYYHPSEEQKTGELVFIASGLGLVGYLAYKHL